MTDQALALEDDGFELRDDVEVVHGTLHEIAVFDWLTPKMYFEATEEERERLDEEMHRQLDRQAEVRRARAVVDMVAEGRLVRAETVGRVVQSALAAQSESQSLPGPSDTSPPAAPPAPSEEALLTTKESAAYLRISPSTIRGAVTEHWLNADGKNGRGGSYLFRRSTLDEYAARCLSLTKTQKENNNADHEQPLEDTAPRGVSKNGRRVRRQGRCPDRRKDKEQDRNDAEGLEARGRGASGGRVAGSPAGGGGDPWAPPPGYTPRPR